MIIMHTIDEMKKKTYKNSERRHEIFKSDEKLSFSTSIVEYNLHMSESDENVQQRLYYSSHRSNVRYWWSIFCWMMKTHDWWETTYHASRKHLMRMITWRSSTIQILSTKRFDDESHSKLNSSSDDQLRIELDFHAMTSNRDHHFDHHCDHHLKSEHNQQTWRQDDWVDDVEAMRRRWDQIIVLEDESWLMTIILSRWVDYFELKRRLSRLNESEMTI